jgi:hypothetical protein
MSNLWHFLGLTIYEGPHRELFHDYIQLCRAGNGAAPLVAAALNERISLVKIGAPTSAWPVNQMAIVTNPIVLLLSERKEETPDGRPVEDHTCALQAKQWCEVLFICAGAGGPEVYEAIAKIAELGWQTLVIQTSPGRALAWREFMQCRRVTIVWPRGVEAPQCLAMCGNGAGSIFRGGRGNA